LSLTFLVWQAHNKCLSGRTHVLSLFLHLLMVVSILNNILLQTGRYQQGTASAHWCNKIYSCSFYAPNGN